MKKLLLSTMLLALSFAYGQEKKENEKLTIEKGTWYTSANFSIGHNSNEFEGSPETSKYFNFNFSPKVGYTINDNLIIGLGLGYGYSKSESGNEIGKSNSYKIFPYIKKHFPLGKKLTISLQGEFSYSYSDFSNNITPDPYERSTNQYFIGIRPGITYFLNKNIALETNIGSLGYSKIDREDSDFSNSEFDSFSFSINSTDLFFGLSYYW
ncbi:outer membrane beta-barrel protein [Tenacibaculum ascidiaceicola]|uniref:outer membrane beta-barrel protein n=1 Tax=Tenacibaculum TaxID=104267 RepID=UPI0039ED116C